MISVQKLSLHYGQKKVFDNLSIDFMNNQIYGIVGLNGAGKTSFFDVLANYRKADSGTILFNGSRLSNKDIAYVETLNFFYSNITGNEYLKLFKTTNSTFHLEALQSFFKLPLDELIETYSTGMKKKLALLGVLKQDKTIFLFDEPFNGLDIETNKILELIILALKEKGKTIFISSHIIDPLFHICDEIHCLENACFSRSYNKSNYQNIEEELFGKLKLEAKSIIMSSI